jgi:hypothetical protein
VFSYVMTIDGRLSSVSLASVELFPVQAGTRLVYTEQGQYFDGGDQALQREIGCGELYDALGEVLAVIPFRTSAIFSNRHCLSVFSQPAGGQNAPPTPKLIPQGSTHGDDPGSRPPVW